MLFSTTKTTLLALTSLLSTTHAIPQPPPAAPSAPSRPISNASVNTTSVGVYTCSGPNWTSGCAWEDSSGMPRCRMIPWTDALTHSPENGQLAKVSIGPDAGNHCILYEDSRCGGAADKSYLLRYPGTTDMYEWAKTQGLDEGKQGLWSMLCLTEGLIGYYYKGKGWEGYAGKQ